MDNKKRQVRYPVSTAEAGRIVSVSSGKGGTGKSIIAFNLAERLTAVGHRVLLVDADLTCGNLHVLANCRPERSVRHILRQETTIDSAISVLSDDLHLLSAPGCPADVRNFGTEDVESLMSTLRQSAKDYEFIIVDLGSGISEFAEQIALAADRNCLVVLPELTSLANAYGLFKQLVSRKPSSRTELVVNRVRDIAEVEFMSASLSELTERFLSRSIPCLGFVPEDDTVRRSVAAQAPVSQIDEQAPAVAALTHLAQRLTEVTEVEASFNDKSQATPINDLPAMADIRR